jgi:hypothetical protein
MRTPDPCPACLTDAASVDGLRRLARTHPNWAELLAARRPPRFSLTAADTLEAAFQSGAFERLFPRGPDDLDRTYADRGSTKRLIRVFPGKSFGSFTDSDVRAYTDGDLEGTPASPSTRERDAAFLRAALHRFAEVAGVSLSLDARARPRPGRTNSPPRAPQAEDILSALAAAPRPVRRAVALALGAGATPAELSRVVVGDVVQLRDRQLFVLLGTEHGRRPVALSQWCTQSLVDGTSSDWWRQPQRPLIGLSPEALQRALRTATQNANIEPGTVTSTRLRATFQAVLAPHGAPRAVLRGRWALPPRDQRRDLRHWSERAQQQYAPSLALASRWKVLSEPPGGWPEHVLKRPSGRTRPWEREVKASRLPPLPPSVR